jgi:hypothetical protein
LLKSVLTTQQLHRETSALGALCEWRVRLVRSALRLPETTRTKFPLCFAYGLRFFADCAAKKWPLRGSKSNDLRHKNIFVALKARSQGKQEELQLLRRMFICKTCQIR